MCIARLSRLDSRVNQFLWSVITDESLSISSFQVFIFPIRSTLVTSSPLLMSFLFKFSSLLFSSLLFSSPFYFYWFIFIPHHFNPPFSLRSYLNILATLPYPFCSSLLLSTPCSPSSSPLSFSLIHITSLLLPHPYHLSPSPSSTSPLSFSLIHITSLLHPHPHHLSPSPSSRSPLSFTLIQITSLLHPLLTSPLSIPSPPSSHLASEVSTAPLFLRISSGPLPPIMPPLGDGYMDAAPNRSLTLPDDKISTCCILEAISYLLNWLINQSVS